MDLRRALYPYHSLTEVRRRAQLQPRVQRLLNREADMKSFFSAIFVIAALAFPQAGSAQDAPPIHVLPVDRTPFHVIAFANEYVRMLNAEIPAGRVASYHQHSTDSAFVIVESAKVRAQE